MYIVFKNSSDGCNISQNIISITSKENVRPVIINYNKQNGYFTNKDVCLLDDFGETVFYFTYLTIDGEIISTEDSLWFTIEKVDDYSDKYTS